MKNLQQNSPYAALPLMGIFVCLVMKIFYFFFFDSFTKKSVIFLNVLSLKVTAPC